MNHQSKNWGEIARRYAAELVRHSAVAPNVPGRGSATTAEERAAGYVATRLGALESVPVTFQLFKGLRSIWLFSALVFGFALSGHAAYWLLLRPLGGLGAWLVSALFFFSAAYIFWRKFNFQDYPLRSYLPHGASQNIIARLVPHAETRRRVVLVAHLDSHRSVWVFAADILVETFAVLAPVGVYGLLLAPLAYGLHAASGWWSLGLAGALLALPHFLAWFTGMTADLGPYSPGANDNAAAAGVLLALGERLRDQPLAQTEVWLAFTGCEETGCDGMLALLDAYPDELEQAVFIDLELVGIGERLVYLRSEGLLGRRRIDPQLEALVQAVGAPFNLQGLDAPGTASFTEIGAVRARGHRGVCVLSMCADSELLPEWHRLTDTPDRLDATALERTQAFVWDLLKRLDEEDS